MADHGGDGSSQRWRTGITPFFCYLLLTATVGPLLFGFHLAELNAPQDILTCTSPDSSHSHSFLNLPSCIPMSNTLFGVISSAFTVGGLIGALPTGSFTSRHGRLPALRLTTIFFTLGPITEALAPNIPVMAIGRLISGIGAGASLVVGPIYISEISQPERRGLFGAFTQVMVNFGIFVAQVLGLFLSRGGLWRVILGVGGVIGAAQFVGLMFAVESPKWMVENGKASAGVAKTLQRIRGDGYDVDEEIKSWDIHDDDTNDDTHSEERALLSRNDSDDTSPTGSLNDAHDTLAKPFNSSTSPEPSNRTSISFLTALTTHPYNRATLSVTTVMLAQQLCGINSIIMYGVSLLSTLLSTSAALLLVFVALLNILVTMACAPLVDRLGRKTCLLASITGMGVSSLILAVAIIKHIPALSAIAVISFVSAFGLGLGPVPFILPSEMARPEAVGATQSWALAANWVSTFVVSLGFPVLNGALGRGKVYFVFAALAGFFACAVGWGVPEPRGTRGRNGKDGSVEREETRDD
ncbi:MAG: hypothetical protein M1831_002324 [Alyxoria varia]|nr:MAG: hypothetical protein M1831_002324 [Alyxoria varia]